MRLLLALFHAEYFFLCVTGRCTRFTRRRFTDSLSVSRTVFFCLAVRSCFTFFSVKIRTPICFPYNVKCHYKPLSGFCTESYMAPRILCICAVTWAFVFSMFPLLSMTTSANFSLSASDIWALIRASTASSVAPSRSMARCI